MIDEDALKIDDFSVIGPREEDAASLPSFKPLAEHRRANSTPKTAGTSATRKDHFAAARFAAVAHS
jgi:hypothetical protein